MGSAESLRRAADLLAAGNWEGRARGIVQEDPSPLAAWMHGIVHLLEGDVPTGEKLPAQGQRLVNVRAKQDCRRRRPT